MYRVQELGRRYPLGLLASYTTIISPIRAFSSPPRLKSFGFYERPYYILGELMGVCL